MKKYLVYGMGNAIVDAELTVPFSFLSDLGIEFGAMSLVERGRQDEILHRAEKEMGKIPALSCGGSVANSISAIVNLGGACFFNGLLGNDEDGAFYKENLISCGVGADFSKQKGITGRCLALITPDGERTMLTALGDGAKFGEENIIWPSLEKAEYLFVEGYLASDKSSHSGAIRAVNFAREKKIKTVLSFSDPSMAKYFPSELASIVGEGVEIIFCNGDEALAFTGKNDLSSAMDKLSSLAKEVVITLGAEGAFIFGDGKRVKVSAPKVEVVDTIGAGDIFAGVYLHARSKGSSLNGAGELACKVASHLVTKFGPRLEQTEIESSYSH